MRNTCDREEDKMKERENIKEALTRCGYPQWAISTVQRKMKKKEETEKDEKEGRKRWKQTWANAWWYFHMSKDYPKAHHAKIQGEYSNEASPQY